MNDLPSVALTQRFLVLCEQYGSQRLAVQVVAVGRSTGVEGLPASDDWTTWTADEMRRSTTCSASASDPAGSPAGPALPRYGERRRPGCPAHPPPKYRATAPSSTATALA